MTSSSLVRILFIAAAFLITESNCAAYEQQQQQQRQRYAAIPEETAHPPGGQGLLMPRIYYEAPLNPLQKRQNGVCESGFHPCNELGLVPPNDDVCCPNTHYCIINTTSPLPPLKATCCRIGATCNNNPSPICSEPSFFLCFPPLTTTLSSTPTLLPQTTSSACCPRPCILESQYQCPSSLGGLCCPNTAGCGSNNQCFHTLPPSSPSTPLATPVPEGCITGQISCANQFGGGCCNDKDVCTKINEEARCARRTDLPDDVNLVHESKGLSTGAKAGIAVGVVVFAAGVMGGITWWCIKKRRGKEGTETGNRPRVRPGQTIIGGGMVSGQSQTREVFSDAGVSSRLAPGIGTQEYTGPDAVVGPYSDEYEERRGGSPPSAVTSPGIGIEEYHSTGRAVFPVVPEGPGDFTRAVEIDSGEKGESHQTQGHSRDVSGSTTGYFGGGGGGYFASGVFGAGTGGGGGRPRPETNLSSPGAEDISDRFELYGSDPAELSPLSSPYYGYPTSPEGYNNGDGNNGR
ncbi:hypothetical protein QBC38DRAFT_48575 [Podospora fimiseda]|uniref:Uncharacterized protein n=1 Tax=Podospora fimiseda TaxID=252190 RepID=A0AAN7H2K2_9PEZI|nr:hypothetical protein QBC38DRAFT_48575 [Podospora fimiseda]